MILEKWFSVPIGFIDLHPSDVQTINGTINEWIDKNPNLLMTNPYENVLNTYHSDRNIILKPEFLHVEKIFINCAQKYLTLVDMDSENIIIGNSWINVFQPNTQEAEHTHYGSIISGVYYVAGDKDSGNLLFDDPIEVRGLWANIYKSKIKSYQEGVVYQPIVGRIVFFPSWLKHSVTKNNSNNNRISLAFNVYYN